VRKLRLRARRRPLRQELAAVTPFKVDTVDLAFLPNTFTIPANTDVEATFHNKGALPHNWTCDALGLKLPDVPSG
jgi:hypothetical protein